MKKICALLTFLFFVGIFIPAVSAETHIVSSLPYSDTKYEQSFDYYSSTVSYKGRNDVYDVTKGYLIVELSYVQHYTNVHYFMWDCPGNALDGEGQTTCWYSRPSDGAWKPAVIQIVKTRNNLGAVTRTIAYVYPIEWDIGTKTGAWSTILYKDNDGVKSTTPLKTVSFGYNTKYEASLTKTGGSDNYKGGMYLKWWDRNLGGQKTHVEGYTNIMYTLEIEEFGTSYIVDMIRTIGTKPSATTITLKDASSNVLFQDTSSIDKTFLVAKDKLSSVEVVAGTYTNNYNIALGGDVSPTPTTNAVTVYIKNSQTGALIANSQIVIDALVDGEYYNVVNRTEPSGIFSITLQPTGGGQPNPDGYRLIVTADGYNNPMPEINFTVDDYKVSIYCLLDPIAGGPENENKTFIDFFVSDMYANPISGATVKFGKYTLITNSAGYTVFEVDKSNTYTWIVSKSGYGTLTGNAVIGDAPRHTINTVLAPTVTPVKPTPTPPSTPTIPGPIMTAPTGEPVSPWLEWFAAHFGMILGGGVEIGKIFMWLCFTVPVGVYVGKEAKAGAAGFMAGAGIVTLFFVLIGWVPIWLVVLLALIIGLLYAKVFNTQDNGGGR